MSGVTDVIFGETVRASQAEAALSGLIESLSSTTSGDVATLTEAIENEVARATAAETALDNRVTALEEIITDWKNNGINCGEY